MLWYVLLFAFDGSKQGVSHSSITWENLITLASKAVGTTFSLMQGLTIMFKIRGNKKLILYVIIIIIITSDYIFS
jgi:hypothetical protein